MNETLVLVLTAVVAVATTVYTVDSVRLFRASQTAKEIARQAALLQLWERVLEHSRRHEDAPTARTLDARGRPRPGLGRARRAGSQTPRRRTHARGD